jgi:hypothetical protein
VCVPSGRIPELTLKATGLRPTERRTPRKGKGFDFYDPRHASVDSTSHNLVSIFLRGVVCAALRAISRFLRKGTTRK